MFWFLFFDADFCLGDFDFWVRLEVGFFDFDFLEDLINFLEEFWVCWLFEDFDDLVFIFCLDWFGEKLRMIFLFDLEVWWLSIILFDELGLVLRNEVDEFVNKYKLILICKYKIIGYIYIDCELCIFFFISLFYIFIFKRFKNRDFCE